MDEYQTWIREYLSAFVDPSHCLGQCKIAAEEMQAAFPELQLVRGHVYCPAPWGKRAHWWLETPNGDLVDPTAAQFPLVLEYEPYAEGDPVRLGRCMDCGEEIWGDPENPPRDLPFCSPGCHDAFASSLMGEY